MIKDRGVTCQNNYKLRTDFIVNIKTEPRPVRVIYA